MRLLPLALGEDTLYIVMRGRVGDAASPPCFRLGLLDKAKQPKEKNRC